MKYTYGAGTRLSSLYTAGRDGKPCPPHAGDKTSEGYRAWKTGADERGKICFRCETPRMDPVAFRNHAGYHALEGKPLRCSHCHCEYPFHYIIFCREQHPEGVWA